jgi:hypothetical protein
MHWVWLHLRFHLQVITSHMQTSTSFESQGPSPFASTRIRILGNYCVAWATQEREYQ